MITCKRTNQTMHKSFVTCPNDVFTIKGSKYCISDSITIEVSNKSRDELFSINLPNKIESWQLLLQLDNMGGRSVFNQHGSDNPEPFKESAPYKARF